MYIYILVFVQICLLVAGQILLKAGIDKLEEFSIQSVFNLVSIPQIWGGLFIYGVAIILWFYILFLGKDKFSIIYPLGSLAYVLGVVVAMVIFKETIPFTRWIGVGFILVGAFFIAK